jgi:hypothetical protein
MKFWTIWACLFSVLGTTCFAKDGVDVEAYRRTVKKNISSIRTCYSRELANDPKLSGKLVIDWKVDDKGIATEAIPNAQKTTLKNNAVASCVVDKIITMKFPHAALGQSVSISYPFTFTNGSKK